MKHTDEAKRKISKALKGRKFSDEHRKNLSASLKNSQKLKEAAKKRGEQLRGRVVSEETRQKLRESMRGKHGGKNNPFYGRKHSEETKRRISESEQGEKNHNWGKTGVDCAHYGRKASEEELAAKRARMLGKKNPMYGKTPWNKGLTKQTHPSIKAASEKTRGRKVKEETRKKLSDSMMGRFSGEKHHNWKGGLKDNPYGVEFNEKLREQVRERDNRKCVLCGGHDDDRKLQTHHIDYDKTNNDPSNLCSLCLSCHVKTNYNREHWRTILPSLIEF